MRWFGVALVMVVGVGAGCASSPPPRRPATLAAPPERRAPERTRHDDEGTPERRLAVARALIAAERYADGADALERVARELGPAAPAALWREVVVAWWVASEQREPDARRRAGIAEQEALHHVLAHGAARELVDEARRRDAGGDSTAAVRLYRLALERGLPATEADVVAPTLCELARAAEEPAVAQETCAVAASAVSERHAAGLVLRRAELLRLAGRAEDAAVLADEALKRARAPAVVGRLWALRARLAAARGDHRASRTAWAKAERALRRAREDAELADDLAEGLAALAGARSEQAARVALPPADPEAFTLALRERARLARDAVEAWRRVVGTRSTAWAGRAALGEADVYAALYRAMEAAIAASPSLRDLPPEPHAGRLDERVARYRDEAWRGYGAALRLARTGPVAATAARAIARMRPDDYPVAGVARLGEPVVDPKELRGRMPRAPHESARDPDGAEVPVARLHAAWGAASDRPALGRRTLERAWRLADRLEPAEAAAWYLSAARLWAWLGEHGYAREALERAVTAADPPAAAFELLGADDLATLRYTDAETAFRRAAHLGEERGCASLLGYALARVGEAKGDPTRFPAEPLAEYLQRCEDPDPLALLWLARHRAAGGDPGAAAALCRRYLAAPSGEDPTDGVGFCHGLASRPAG